MTDREEWGPWIEHDGKGCPCVGMWVHVVGVYMCGSKKEQEGIARRVVAWDWSNFGAASCDPITGWTIFEGKVIRYRIRKPRGLTMLQDLIADQKVTV